jgi:hypothetical protein
LVRVDRSPESTSLAKAAPAASGGAGASRVARRPTGFSAHAAGCGLGRLVAHRVGLAALAGGTVLAGWALDVTETVKEPGLFWLLLNELPVGSAGSGG